MNESQLRDILYSCKTYDEAETRRRADTALQSRSAIESIKQSTGETVTWLADSASKLGIELRKLLRAPVWVVPNPTVGVYCVRADGMDDIVVYEATFQLLAFIIWFWACIARTKGLMDRTSLSPADRDAIEGQMNEALKLAVPLFAHSIKVPGRLPDLRAGLTSADTNTAAIHLVLSEVFMLLHEQAHIDLGHTGGDGGKVLMHSQFEAEDETDDYIAGEYEADRRAIASVPDPLQGYVAFGAGWFLMAVAYHEAFLSRVSAKHPWAINRMKAIMDAFGSRMRDSDRSMMEEMMRMGQDTMTTGKRFANVPDSEKLNMMFYGRAPAYAADFIEWFFPFTNQFLMRARAGG
jgi:hypothetical protein